MTSKTIKIVIGWICKRSPITRGITKSPWRSCTANQTMTNLTAIKVESWNAMIKPGKKAINGPIYGMIHNNPAEIAKTLANSNPISKKQTQ